MLKVQKKYRRWKLKVCNAKNEIIMLLSKCTVLDNKMLRFIKEQEASGLLSSLVIKKPLS